MGVRYSILTMHVRAFILRELHKFSRLSRTCVLVALVNDLDCTLCKLPSTVRRYFTGGCVYGTTVLRIMLDDN